MREEGKKIWKEEIGGKAKEGRKERSSESPLSSFGGWMENRIWYRVRLLVMEEGNSGPSMALRNNNDVTIRS